MRIEEEKRLQRMESKMLRWMAGDKKMEEQEFRKLLGVEDLQGGRALQKIKFKDNSRTFQGIFQDFKDTFTKISSSL